MPPGQPQRASHQAILNPTQSRIPPTRGRVTRFQRASDSPILNPTRSRTPPTRGRVKPAVFAASAGPGFSTGRTCERSPWDSH